MPTLRSGKAWDFPKLHLTSPAMKGEHVRTAQHLLKHNRWEKNFMPDAPIDGVYGPHTARAVKRAQYYIGVQKRYIHGQFTKRMYGYLIGKHHVHHRLRDAAMIIRAKRRARKAVESIGYEALKVALTQLNVHEDPAGSNRVKYSLWYGLVGPWCAMFESWCFAQVRGTFRYSYVPAIHQDARWGNHGLSITHAPEPGDIACYTFTSVDQHTGFFEKWEAKGYSFWAVEGNTSSGTSGSQDNGGIVARRLRYVSQVSAFVKVSR